MADRLDTSNLIPMRFHGNAREYFVIWIENVLLSITTLGIYLAWAKVRNQKYFLGSTTIDERAFAYHATGMQILIGRVVFVSVTVAAIVIGRMSPFFMALAAYLYLWTIPWMINRGLRFGVAMTTWSNVRFRFEGDYVSTLIVFVVYPLLSACTLFVAFPFAAREMSRYKIGSYSLGKHEFSFDSPIQPYYFALLMAVLCVFFGAFCALLVSMGSIAVVYPLGVIDSDTIALGILLFAFMSAGVAYAAFTRNAAIAGMTLEDGHRFHSTISPLELTVIIMTNFLAIIVSAGLLTPWARIRVMRYLCEHTWVEPNGSLDEFVADLQQSTTAADEAFMDIESIDVGNNN